jgi:hypothetical protein
MARSHTFTAVPPPEAYNAAPGKAQPHSTGLPWFTWRRTVKGAREVEIHEG